jgi:FkbM family methyltransferase
MEKSVKTRFFNFFRRFLTSATAEKWLMKNFSGADLYRRIVPPEYLYPKGSMRTFEREGVKYRLDISNVVDHYVYFGFEPFYYSKVEEAISKAKVILDIGANIGVSFSWFSVRNPRASIIGFEPHPETIKRANEQISLNGFTNVELLQIGLGNTDSSLTMYEVEDHNPGMNRISFEKLDRPSTIIPVRRLDDVLMEKKIDKVDFIKMDVEGFEYFVLEGAVETLKKFPVLFIEVDDRYLKQNGQSASRLVALLEQGGYNSFRRADTDAFINSSSKELSNCHFDLIAEKC